jgi:hypothetical protein
VPQPRDVVTSSSNDNRAINDPNVPPAPGFPGANSTGALVKLTVPVAETDAVGPFPSPLGVFAPGGIPTCNADLGAVTGAPNVTCTGLVPGEHYTVNGVGKNAVDDGTITVSVPVHRGGTVALSNVSRTLTTLSIANLRVDLTGDNSKVSGGTCSPDQYYGAGLTSAPTSAQAGFPAAVAGGASGTGTICPASGSAAGLSSGTIAQTDELSGGQTQTEVADIVDTSPIEGETLYGTFTALAETTDGISPVSLTVTRAGGGSRAIPGNVNTANGVTVSGLAPGNYTATWTITDPNGDTRTVTTRFIEQSPLQGAQGPQGPQGGQGQQGAQGPQGPPGPKPTVKCKLVKHHKIECTVTFPKGTSHGIVRVAVARGGKLVALGHAAVNHGRAKLTMSELRVLKHGTWEVTVVFSRTVKGSTNTVTVAVR